jgi:hypothetical protein
MDPAPMSCSVTRHRSTDRRETPSVAASFGPGLQHRAKPVAFKILGPMQLAISMAIRF